MTTVYEHDVKCAHCGLTRSHLPIGSTNAMGYPDLDLRPGECSVRPCMSGVCSVRGVVWSRAILHRAG
jgi:hypothetical protein